MVTVQIDTTAGKLASGGDERDIVTLSEPVYGYLDKKWTFEEYLEELKEPIDYADPNDPSDPRYYRKYARDVPPPEAFYLVPEKCN